jgi:hypothetical protein
MPSTDLIPFVKAASVTKSPYVGQYAVDALSGAGQFPVQFENDTVQVQGTIWTMFYVPASSLVVVFETSEANKDMDITFSSSITISGYTACTFQGAVRVMFARAMEKQIGVSSGAVVVTAVVNAVTGNPASTNCAPTVSPPARRQLAAGRVAVGIVAAAPRRLAGDGIKIEYSVVLRNARDVARAQLIFEELKDYEQLAKDPVLQAALVKAFVAEGLVGDDPINNPISVISGGKPKSTHQSTIYTKPSFGKGAKPLAPVNPTKKGGIGEPNIVAPDYTGAIIGLIVGSLIVVGFSFWFVHIRHEKPTHSVKGEARAAKGGEPSDARNTLYVADPDGDGLELTEMMDNSEMRRELRQKAANKAAGDGVETKGESKGDDGGSTEERVTMSASLRNILETALTETPGDDEAEIGGAGGSDDIDGKDNSGLMQLDDLEVDHHVHPTGVEIDLVGDHDEEVFL